MLPPRKPPQKKEFKPLAGLSVIGGVQKNKHVDASAPVYGIEFSMECPLIQTGKSRIRQQLTLMRQEGKDYKSFSVEVNPQYKIFARSSLELGAGPVAGFIFTGIRDDNKPVFNYGLATGAVYYFKKVFIGFESRYTMKKQIDRSRRKFRSARLYIAFAMALSRKRPNLQNHEGGSDQVN